VLDVDLVKALANDKRLLILQCLTPAALVRAPPPTAGSAPSSSTETSAAVPAGAGGGLGAEATTADPLGTAEQVRCRTVEVPGAVPPVGQARTATLQPPLLLVAASAPFEDHARDPMTSHTASPFTAVNSTVNPVEDVGSHPVGQIWMAPTALPLAARRGRT
jgi:hypothetical protein